MASKESASQQLSPEQTSVLFDVLTHYETYAEITAFKYPNAIHEYGPPFQDKATKTNSPVLQTLLSKFVLPLPGLRDVSANFWKVQISDLIEDLSKAELSESYDKGVLGIRKTLATAISALIEYPARGCLGGLSQAKEGQNKGRKYDIKNPEDVLQAWQDCVQALVYGDLIDEMFKKAAETDDLAKHDSVVQGMHEFVVVNIASLMHYTLVLSPEGPSLLRMIENVHRLLPYTMIRQTLKIGNVASMISGVMRIVLAKVSIASVTNWMGWSSGADEGMNLLQQIISQVLGWEQKELKNRAAKIEKDKNAPPKAVLNELKEWMTNRSREEHEETRRQSQQQGKSVVAVILSLSSTSADSLTEAQHAQALEYLSLKLAFRDRQEIIRVLCQRTPDHLTAAIKDGVDAYTPMIRQVHQAVNLSDTVWDFERFTTDMLKISKPQGKKGNEKPPSVEDFVDLLHRHQNSSHKFLHQVAKNGKEVISWWKDYVHMAAGQFKTGSVPPSSASVVPDNVAVGGAKDKLKDAYSQLSENDQKYVLTEVVAYDKYLQDLHTASATRISAVIKRTHSTPFGPGAYLARWQQLMDSTSVTPDKLKGPVRHGNSRSVKEAGRKNIDGEEAGFVGEEEAEKAIDEKTPQMPPVEKTIKLLGERFKNILSGAD